MEFTVTLFVADDATDEQVEDAKTRAATSWRHRAIEDGYEPAGDPTVTFDEHAHPVPDSGMARGWVVTGEVT